VTLVGNSAHIRAIQAKVAAWGVYTEPVLILGESGTGKEVVAHAVHAASSRQSSGATLAPRSTPLKGT
jgi:transcriptional regulator with PAS, ATPase and Fis domain